MVAFHPHLHYARPGRAAFAVLVCVLFIFAPQALDAANGTRWTTNYYQVTGATVREIQASIRKNRPDKVARDALTEWSVRSRFGTAKLKGAYRCSGFTTTTLIRITLPRWIPPEGVSDDIKQEWERYIAVLKEHEAGHGRIAMAAAGELHRRVASVGMADDPDSLRSTVQGLVLQTLDEFRQRDREYDRLTRHGLEQGATLSHRRDRPDADPHGVGRHWIREGEHRRSADSS